jgi:protein SCO1
MASSNLLKAVRWGLWGAVALAAAGWAAYATGALDILRGKTAGGGITLQGAVAIGGPFRLTSHEGRPFDSAELKGKPYALFFGFTHCPDVCPTTLLEMTQHLAALGPAADKLKVLFVSVDPERDTPKLLKDYLTAFDHRIIGLTGTPAEIAAVARSYRAYYEKVPGKDAGKDGAKDTSYTMNHAASVYMMDAAGKFVGTFNFQEKQEIQRAKLGRLVAP